MPPLLCAWEDWGSEDPRTQLNLTGIYDIFGRLCCVGLRNKEDDVWSRVLSDSSGLHEEMFDSISLWRFRAYGAELSAQCAPFEWIVNAPAKSGIKQIQLSEPAKENLITSAPPQEKTLLKFKRNKL